VPLTLRNTTADVFIPDDCAGDAALERITHLGIGAHQDDLEFMAFHGIATCHASAKQWFAGVVCTNGAGSARSGAYAGFSDEQMMAARRNEQRKAAELGRYGAMIQLDYASAAAKDAGNVKLGEDLVAILAATRPEVVYTHNLADKHDTHVAVALHVIHALRTLTSDERPKAVYGCEVWRDLDWMPDREKVAHDLSGHEALAASLGRLFESQIGGGKRYDLAVAARRRANATFFESHGVDRAESLSFAMDLTPLIRDDRLDVTEFVTGCIDRFRSDVETRLNKYRSG
jgi:LmbE family N-acetylglucosaminyl deacetylase